MTSAPLDPLSPGRSARFTLSRTYEAVDDPEDVRQEKDGHWSVRAGARVQVRLTIHVPERHYHVALVDPLPAGLESLTPEREPWRWFNHENRRDDRSEVFASVLAPGDYTYSHLARATTPGTFVAPGARIEAMYQPEEFGKSAGDLVLVAP